MSADVSTGWDVGFRPSILILQGRITHGLAKSENEVREALGYLVRGAVLQLGRPSRQPEGMRDTLYGIAGALSDLEDGRRAHRIEGVAERVVDFGSWLNAPSPACRAGRGEGR